jgi:hypothetical protein
MKKVFVLLWISSFAFAQNKQDNEAIKKMCGCYEVTFEFGETFSPQKDYKFHENYYSTALEWVQLVEDEKKRIVLQHLLIVQDSTGKQEIVKHWRQDWLYENTDFYMYDKDNQWKFVRLPKNQVKGQWTQKVFQVDDSPRYEGSATWIHTDGRHYWENTTDSPLPRREFTKRNDYNVLKRRNRHEIMPWGWLHEQDNNKILRQESQDKLIAREKGWDTYKKVEDSRCQIAQKWWTENQKFWAEVRKEWTQIFAQNKNLKLAKAIEGKPMFMHVFALKPEETAQIRPTIQKFVQR